MTTARSDTSRVVLRIPSEDFQRAMDELEQVASLENSTITAEDVTTQVINNRVRIRAQKASIARIQALFARAQNIGDIIRIEGQLSRRQANLTSLERQQAYLSDQTSMSTITVYLERTPEKAPPKEESEDQAGFVAGLDAAGTPSRRSAPVLPPPPVRCCPSWSSGSSWGSRSGCWCARRSAAGAPPTRHQWRASRSGCPARVLARGRSTR